MFEQWCAPSECGGVSDVVFHGDQWSTKRHDSSGEILHREVSATVVYRRFGHQCRVWYGVYRQAHAGGGQYEPLKRQTRGYERPVACATVDLE